jgi:hypothetical protein
MRAIAWLNDRFVASGWYSKLRVSTDGGTTFTSNRTDSELTPALAYGDDIYFAAGVNLSDSSADIDLLSLDGVMWTSSAAPTTADRNGAAFFKHTFITVGDGGTIWQSADVTPSDTVGNEAPTFAGYSTSTTFATPVAIPAATLVAATTDDDGDLVLLTSAGPASAQGGSVTLVGNIVTYTPPATFSGEDTFPVTFTDARGATVSGTVNITVEPLSEDTIPGPVTLILAENQAVLSYQGIAGQSYPIQRSLQLTDWTNIGIATAGPDGTVSFTDPSPPDGKAFYRIVLP